MKFISIVTPCYNEEKNVNEIYTQIKNIFNKLKKYKYEHIFIDNNSSDTTVKKLKAIAKKDKNIKIIINAKNFGHIRSPYHAILQTKGDATIIIASDMQEPPDLVEKFVEKWEEGFNIIIGIKNGSKENPFMSLVRKSFYCIIDKISEIEHIKNFTGFGLYDKVFIDTLKSLNEPYPYFRGLVSELGFNRYEIEYTQAKRKNGKSKNNFYTLYDIAMLGFINHSKLPLRLASFIGFFVAILSLIIAFIYFVYKLLYWNEFPLGSAPVIIGIFFFAAVQLFFIGIIGEYIGAIFTQIKNRPLVIEKERINFK